MNSSVEQPAKQFQTWQQKLIKHVFFGVQPTREILAVVSIYFTRGILHLAVLAIIFFLKDELGLSPAVVAAIQGFLLIPWMCKPVLGFLSDSVPILGYRRRSYLLLAGITCSTTLLML
ncbi:MAG: PucC family protein, partial [Cyanobacteria bacterium P01_H01_bin.121]